MSQPRILIVDDEPNLMGLLQEWLEAEEYEVHCAREGGEALPLFFKLRPDLAVTALRMPGMDGFQLIRRIREISSDSHIMVLSALANEENMVRGLELGADEYVVKPVSKKIFLAKVRSLLRRATATDQDFCAYSDSELSLNFLTYEVVVNGRALSLRPTAFRLLSFLVQNHHRVVGYQELLDRVWGDEEGSLDSLKWHIAYLRGEVEEDRNNPRRIVTLARVGYRYYPPECPPSSRGTVAIAAASSTGTGS